MDIQRTSDLVVSREDGSLRRLATEGRLLVPTEVELRSGQLCWRLAIKEIPAPADLLLRFCGLAEAEPGEILKFAANYGVLTLCRDDLPAPHSDRCWEPFRRLGSQHREAITSWRRYAVEARSLLAIAASLRANQTADAKEWEVVASSPVAAQLGWPDEGFMSRVEPPIRRERLALATMVNTWLALGRVQPRLLWWEEYPEFRLGGGSLFPALSAQLVLAVSREEGFAICSVCGHPYLPQPGPEGRIYTPRVGQRRYCGSEECKRKATAIWKREWRGRQRRPNSDGSGAAL